MEYHTFKTVQDARDYRHNNGTGGWIFAPVNLESKFYPDHEAILFPPEFMPAQIFNHPFTKGRNGMLIGN